jgi:hypothetical protein
MCLRVWICRISHYSGDRVSVSLAGALGNPPPADQKRQQPDPRLDRRSAWWRRRRSTRRRRRGCPRALRRRTSRCRTEQSRRRFDRRRRRGCRRLLPHPWQWTRACPAFVEDDVVSRARGCREAERNRSRDDRKQQASHESPPRTSLHAPNEAGPWGQAAWRCVRAARMEETGSRERFRRVCHGRATASHLEEPPRPGVRFRREPPTPWRPRSRLL